MNPRRYTGFTVLQLIIVLAILAVLVAVLLPAIARAPRGRPRVSCANNLKQFGLILHMYAGENNGRYPGPSVTGRDATPPTLRLDSTVIYPDYWTDMAIAYCPRDESAPTYDEAYAQLEALPEDGTDDCRDALLSSMGSYAYLPWLVQSEAQLVDLILSKTARNAVTFNQAVMSGIEEVRQCGFFFWKWPPDAFTGPLKAAVTGSSAHEGKGGADALYPVSRLPTVRHEGPKQVYPKAAARTPIMLDAVSSGEGGHTWGKGSTGESGRNVLFLDGHVALIKVSDSFPVPGEPPGPGSEDMEWALALAIGRH